MISSLQAQQINAHLMLTSAFYWIASANAEAGQIILTARAKIAIEMDSMVLVTAVSLSAPKDYWGRAA